MAEPLLGQAAGVHRPRNVDWKRAAALLYGDWGTSKAYVIGLAFVAAGFSSFPIILAVCALTAVGRLQLYYCLQPFSGRRRRLFRRAQTKPLSRVGRCFVAGGEFHCHGRTKRMGGGELSWRFK